MNARRNKLEIIHDILRAVQDKGGIIKPTHLLYKSNLSHQRMKEYVEELKQKNMLREEMQEDDRHMFMLTDQGFEFLANYKKLREFTDMFGL
ncbi:MAG: winged helix-turn-helix domain-containing protein [Nanoarchaeota archaeon]